MDLSDSIDSRDYIGNEVRPRNREGVYTDRLDRRVWGA